MTTVTFQVKGMSCSHCVHAVESALKAAGASGKVDLASGEVQVQFQDGKVTIDALKEAIEEQGYDVVGYGASRPKE